MDLQNINDAEKAIRKLKKAEQLRFDLHDLKKTISTSESKTTMINVFGETVNVDSSVLIKEIKKNITELTAEILTIENLLLTY